ncbi:hypothetical protein PCH_Pc12g04990 [Penicillium rubens Wisconsin 54-1255]|uniref:Uncharacterized protein n=1 Tax=Penicillium rubens (strain ATCC 28089 / DSM 1075 / NRRL 1951 / Wisconsin 54-1255) TaxID=500485 RepID=B6GYT9_PENRW|nr:hypothetical protein PCH_Pc12g04990 [Penicillium rubens Wisconsin 54-1255]
MDLKLLNNPIFIRLALLIRYYTKLLRITYTLRVLPISYYFLRYLSLEINRMLSSKRLYRRKSIRGKKSKASVFYKDLDARSRIYVAYNISLTVSEISNTYISYEYNNLSITYYNHSFTGVVFIYISEVRIIYLLLVLSTKLTIVITNVIVINIFIYLLVFFYLFKRYLLRFYFTSFFYNKITFLTSNLRVRSYLKSRFDLSSLGISLSSSYSSI